jgi:ribonuclease BN (tRNA processing enzyme)
VLETPLIAVMLDCGFGSYASFLEHTPDSPLDAIFLSHAHRDHSFDLEAFVTSPSVWRDRPRVLASRATLGALPFDIASSDAEVTVLNDGSRVDSELLRMECSLTTHQMATLAAQVSVGGSRVVYSADTGPGWAFPPAFCRPDLAILECTLETRDLTSSTFHLDAEEAASLAQSLAGRKTLITHVPPHENGQVRLEIAKRTAPTQEFLLAATGQQVDVPSASEVDNYK